MKLYAYCLASGIDSLPQPVQGISAAPVRLLKVENLVVLVSDLDTDAVSVTRENALTHAAVVRSVLDQTTPLPFRFGTLVTEQQLTNYISARKPALETKLETVRGCVEMSVKIIWDFSGHDQPEPPQKYQENEQGAGALFLAEKRREILGDERRAAHASEISTWLQENLNALARDKMVTVRPEGKLVLSAAHLVERSKIGQYRAKVEQLRADRPELHFLLSGPWPPYSFANVELEFKSQFGVS
ncbi:MAG TPA: GvpL/GvpF family gas vesicle protein [Pyrinomonadaceae bacterium]|nr:GvpL/GvpF family gas vesicle protein [Pyrinomonadaceae bacterium]